MSRSYGTTNAAPYAAAPAVGLAGDTYFNTTDKFLYLSDGTQWIVASGGGGGTSGAYGCRIRRNVDQSIPNLTTTTVLMNTVMVETTPGATWYDSVSGGLKVPVGAGGRYFLSAHCRWEAQQVVGSCLIIYVNGSPVVRDAPGAPATQYFEQHCACAWTLNAGDIITLGVNHNSGVARIVSTVTAAGTDPTGPILEAWKIDSKGDKGDTGTPGVAGNLASAYYFYAAAVSASGLAAATNNVVTWQFPAALNNGFTFTANSTNIVVQQAGKYLVDALITVLTTAGSVNGMVRIQHLNSALTVLAQRDTIPGAAPAAATWAQWEGQALLDCAVGDIIQIFTNNATGTYTVDARSYLMITPVGGAKGADGIPGNLAAASYWWGPTTGGGGITTGAFTQITFTTPYQVAGFSLGAGGGSSLNTPICNIAGKYRCRFSATLDPAGACDLQVRLQHYRAAAVISTSVDQVGSSSAGEFVGLDVEAIFDLQSGDSVAAYVYCSTATNIDSRSYIEITPVSGSKGDTGLQGPVGTTPAFWFSAFSGPSQLSGSQMQITPADTTSKAGFYRHANGTVVICDQAGWYRIGIHLTEQPGTAVSQYTDVYISIRDRDNYANALYQSNPVAMGLTTTVGYYFAADGELIGYMRVGDMVNIAASVDQMKILYPARSYLSIMPVISTGPQGPQGIDGIPGSAANVGGYYYGNISPKTLTTSASEHINSLTAPTQVNGFTLNAGTQLIRCDIAGRYYVNVELTGQGAVSQYSSVMIDHMRGVTLIRRAETVTNGPPTANWYTVLNASGIFSLSVGDEIKIYAYTQQPNLALDARSNISIIPVGGAKGDPGTPVNDGVRLRYSGAAFTIATSTVVNMPLDLLIETAGATYTYNSGTREITIPNDGLYSLHSSVQGENQNWSTGGMAYLDIKVNGVQVSNAWPSTALYVGLECNVQMLLKAGDKITTAVGNYTGLTLTVRSSPGVSNQPPSPMLSVWRIGTGLQGPSGGPVPTGGTAGQIIVKQSVTDFAVAWQPQTGACIARRAGTSAGLNLPSNGSTMVIFHGPLVISTLVTGRLYRLAWNARAIGATTGLMFQVHRDGVQYAAIDGYIAAGTGSSWDSIYWETIIPGTGNEGSHTWTIKGTSATASVSQIYADGGAGCQMAMWDAGVDPGSQ